MLKPTLFPYQQKTNDEVARLFQKYRKVLIVLPGGGGKTIVSGSMAERFHFSESQRLIQYQLHLKKKVAFFTHREELFNQTREKFLSFGNITEPINADTTHINPHANTFVVMVETFDRRSDSETFIRNFKDVGLVFIDEAHRTDFNKILHHFPDAYIVGLTATPISTDKKKPLNTVWDVMYEAATTTELQALNSENPKVGVVPCDCYSLGSVDRAKLAKKGNDFDNDKMSNDFRSLKQRENVLAAYDELGKGMKGLCFTVDIKHNEELCSEFTSIGVPSRQLHSDSKKWFGAPSSSLAKNWRIDTLRWFKSTPGSLIHNVGILTTGFDEPSTELIMTVFASLSISKVVQCHVRGARPYQYPNGEWKQLYRWLDFGRNCEYFSTDGNNNLPWKDYFDMPASTRTREGVGGYKSCPECGNMQPVAARICEGIKIDWLSQEGSQCGYVFPFSEKEEDLVPRVMVKYFTDGIVVSDLIKLAQMNGYQLTSVYFSILDRCVALGLKSFGTFLLKEQFSFIADIAFKKIRELGKITGKKCWRENVEKSLMEKMKKAGFVIDVEELGDEATLKELEYQERKSKME